MSGDGDVSPKELDLDVPDDRGTTTEVLMRRHLEGFLGVQQEPDCCILQVIHSREVPNLSGSFLFTCLT